MIPPQDRAPAPLGAHCSARGVTFTVVASRAERVELCLFDSARRETSRQDMTRLEHGVWRAEVAGGGPGLRYGYRVHGPWDPSEGLYHNPAKLLVDPYARLFDGPGASHASLRTIRVQGGPDGRDSAPKALRGVVVAEGEFEWGSAERHPQTPWAETVIYEAHVRGLTQLHPAVSPEDRGTYRALGHPAVIEHLKRLGVTCLELLPIHARAPEPFLADKGLSNYWGYASLGFFAPHLAYARDPERAPDELKFAIRALHAAGIEVVLDVVYNHTHEGGPSGPTQCFRGFDSCYYRLGPGGEYEDFTGCGNTFDLRAPRALQLVMDSLRFWVEEYHVDGFRFDLAPAMARRGLEEPPLGEVFATILQDPVLNQVKLIAEPWDLGPYGYRLGAFPPGWVEWNGEYRDATRRFWRGERGVLGEFVERLCGSSDRFGGPSPRGPLASINYVTCHDGFTLADLVSYERKHNEANLEQNRDGHEPSYGRAWGGPEGPSSDPETRALRARVQRAFLATLALSQGVPMLNMGDERGRSQGGNNNAYCQDNATSWLDWSEEPEPRALERFTARVFELRRRFPQLRRARHFRGGTTGQVDLFWLQASGAPMTPEAWAEQSAVTAWIESTPEAPELLLLFNAGEGPRDFQLPSGRWRRLLDSAAPEAEEWLHTERVTLAAPSVVVLAQA